MAESEIRIYQSEDEEAQVQVKFNNETQQLLKSIDFLL
jgi:hypothetical protein